MSLDHPEFALPPGFRCGGYDIVRVLGSGGFGITYQARIIGQTGGMVAIKEFFPQEMVVRLRDWSVAAAPGTSDADIGAAVEMFIREAERICSLSHPNIVRGLEAFREHNTAYLVMQYVSGRSLRDSLRDPGGFRASPITAPALFSPLVAALEALHEQHLLHCDIKPENIFLGPGHEPILIDLGSARGHGPGFLDDSPLTYSRYFSAIEQVDENYGPVGPYTDIYQLAAVFYRCLSGGRLPDAEDRALAKTDPYLPLVEIPEVAAVYPVDLLRAVDLGLAFFPAQRPATVSEWRDLFRGTLSNLKRDRLLMSPTGGPPPPPDMQDSPQSGSSTVFGLGETHTYLRADRSEPPSKRDPLVWVAGLVLLLIIAAIIAQILGF